MIKNNFIKNYFYSTVICAIHLQYNLVIYSYKYIYLKINYKKNDLCPTTLTNSSNYRLVSKH